MGQAHALFYKRILAASGGMRHSAGSTLCCVSAMPVFRLLLVLLSAALALPVLADIYKHVDAEGNITFTNQPMRGAQRILVEPGFKPQPRATGVPGRSSASQNPSPSSFPRVDVHTQRERDSNRRLILQEEMANEQKRLSEARRQLQEADATRSAEEKANPSRYLERLGRLREAVQLHEKNLAALQSELSRVK
jgi:hypothetical protein